METMTWIDLVMWLTDYFFGHVMHYLGLLLLCAVTFGGLYFNTDNWKKRHGKKE